MATQTGSFDFKAAKLAKESAEKVAINYLAQDTSGIMVYDGSSGTQTPSSPTSGSKNVFIDSDGMYVRNGSTNLASFTGSSAQIGRSNVAHSIVDANGMRVYASDGSTRIANLGYGEGTAESGTSNAPFYTLGTRYPSTAPQYDATSTYAIGDYCDYAGKVWLCTVAIDTPEAFNRSHWRNLIGNESMAEGRDVEASGYSSHAEGRLTRAYGQYSHAEGYSTEAIGEGSHAEGWHDNQQANVVRGISASGLGSHAEGIAKGSFRIIASGMGSHAEGYARDANNIAQGDGSHVEGRGNTASGLYAHAEGNGNTASGGNSHAEGGITTASGGWSHAEGLETEAYGQGSHAQNHGTVADGAYQTALGRYNTPDTTSAVIIGNGTEATRSNALTVDWNGNVNIASGAKYKINGNNLSASDIANSVTGVKGNSESSYRTGNVNLTPANIGAVPTTRTVNSKALSSNITLSASDVSAVALDDKYKRSATGDLEWTSTTDGDAKVIAKSALAFWNGAYSGNSSNLSKCSTGNIIGSNGGTMTGQLKTSFKESVAMGSYGASATTVANLVAELRYSSGCMGSANITTAYTNGSISMATGWYNFIYSPHRSGGANGAASGDNCNYGNLILMGMTVSGAYLIRVSSGTISEVKPLADGNTSWQSLATDFNYIKRSGMVTVDFYKSSQALSTSWTTIGTLPSGYRPAHTIYGSAMSLTTTPLAYYINSSGTVAMRTASGSGNYATGFNVSFPVL